MICIQLNYDRLCTIKESGWTINFDRQEAGRCMFTFSLQKDEGKIINKKIQRSYNLTPQLNKITTPQYL